MPGALWWRRNPPCTGADWMAGATTRGRMMRRIRNREGPKQADEIRRELGGRNPPHGMVYVMTPVRTTAGINKADAGSMAHGQTRSAVALRQVLPTTVPAMNFVARFASRQPVTDRTNCRLADVLSSAARARRGGVHGQQCDIAGDFVAGSIWLLLQQRWLTEQALGERNYETRQ